MLALRERVTKFLGGDRRELLVQIGWQGALVAAIDPIQRYTVAIANFRCHVDGCRCEQSVAAAIGIL
jgi:hypothetical protein